MDMIGEDRTDLDKFWMNPHYLNSYNSLSESQKSDSDHLESQLNKTIAQTTGMQNFTLQEILL